MKNIITLILVLFANFSFSQSCYGDNPTYYTKARVYLYQEMNSNSAIVKEIPKGEAVSVVSSFFGSTGFWQVCWKGKTAYALKNQLSFSKTIASKRTKKIPATISDNNDIDRDIGFDPFLAQTTFAVNFRTHPSSASEKIKTLSTASTLYVYSKQTINGYYKAIDIMTSEIGWVYKKYVKYVEDIEVDETGAFQSTGYSSSYNSEVNVENKSSYTIKLIVDSETFTLSPNTTRKLEIKPGKKYYIASAPGVIPASGYQSFEANNGYEWSFWVSTSRN